MGINIKVNDGNMDFIGALRALGDAAEPIAKMAVYDGAGAVAEAVKAATPIDTGDLASSVGITKIKVFADVVSTDVGFSGYDSKGVPNMLKARTLESGRHGEYKRPFFRKAVKGVKEKAVGAMASTVDKQIVKTMKGV